MQITDKRVQLAQVSALQLAQVSALQLVQVCSACLIWLSILHSAHGTPHKRTLLPVAVKSDFYLHSSQYADFNKISISIVFLNKQELGFAI